MSSRQRRARAPLVSLPPRSFSFCDRRRTVPAGTKQLRVLADYNAVTLGASSATLYAAPGDTVTRSAAHRITAGELRRQRTVIVALANRRRLYRASRRYRCCHSQPGDWQMDARRAVRLQVLRESFAECRFSLRLLTRDHCARTIVWQHHHRRSRVCDRLHRLERPDHQHDRAL